MYCSSVEVGSIDDLSSERAKVKVYVVNSFVEWQGCLLNEGFTSTNFQLLESDSKINKRGVSI